MTLPAWCDTQGARAIVALGERDGFRCHYCLVRLVDPRSDEGLDRHSDGTVSPLPGWAMPTRDHVIPRSAGGSNHPANLVLACSACNCAKGTTSYADFVGASA